MSLTQTQIDKVREGINIGYSCGGITIPWNRTTINPELVLIDSAMDTTDIAINNTFSVGFMAETTAEDRALIVVALTIARRFAGSPAYLRIIRDTLNRVI